MSGADQSVAERGWRPVLRADVRPARSESHNARSLGYRIREYRGASIGDRRLRVLRELEGRENGAWGMQMDVE